MIMGKRVDEYKPDYGVSPGEVFVAELELRGITPLDFSERSGLPLSEVLALANAELKITEAIATTLERVLGMPTEYWLNLEKHYRFSIG